MSIRMRIWIHETWPNGFLVNSLMCLSNLTRYSFYKKKIFYHVCLLTSVDFDDTFKCKIQFSTSVCCALWYCQYLEWFICHVQRSILFFPHGRQVWMLSCVDSLDILDSQNLTMTMEGLLPLIVQMQTQHADSAEYLEQVMKSTSPYA